MGKHERGYPRVDRDHYPTPAWVTEALLQYVNITGLSVWEPAAGTGLMAEVLRAKARRVYCSDIKRRGYRLDAVHDFTFPGKAPPEGLDCIITNPPFGPRGQLAFKFIWAGLIHLNRGAKLLALLLPADFDSAGGRREVFGGDSRFTAKLVLTRRIVWFERTDGVREAPKENHAWFIWSHAKGSGAALLYDR